MKSNETPPGVEPLPEAAWQRIEHGVFRELGRQPAALPAAQKAARPSPRWPMRTALGLALAAAAALAIIPLVSNRRDGGTSGAEPSRVATAESPVQITVGRTALTVAPHSTIWVSGAERTDVVIMLEHGAVECAVAPSPERPPVVVQAGEVRIEVMGTRFAVWRQGAAARVEVFEGAILAFHRGKRVEIQAGKTWSSERAEAQETPAPAPEEPEEKDTETTAMPDGEPKSPSSAKARDRSAGAVSGEGELQDRALSRPRETAPRADEGASRRAPTAQERYEHAARIEASRPAEAIAIYRELARGTGAWAANALFAEARLALELGNRASAKKLLAEYLRRFPEGINAEDARTLKSTLGE